MTRPAAAGLATAARLLARSAIRVLPAPRPPEEPVAAGWFPSPEACARALGEALRSSVVEGWYGFGGGWPVLEPDGFLLAPGAPGAVGRDGLAGPDGRYRIEPAMLWRDAAGRERPLLSRSPAGVEPAVDLLWFGDGERWVVRGGRLECEDTLCRLTLSATRERLERLLVRARRVEPAALEGLDGPEPGAASLEVRRAEALVGPGWRDPARVAAARVGVVTAALRGDRLALEREDGGRSVSAVVAGGSGWRAERLEGEGPVAALELVLEGGDVVARAELDPRLDPLTPGMRGRLAFDLASDLVVLGRGQKS